MKGVRAAALVLPFLLAGLPVAPTALAQTQSASVSITDTGFNPGVVNIPVGGTVTWLNQGTNVHTATSTSSTLTPGQTASPAPFDSGGLGPGQSFSFMFPLPGTYSYTSQTDCLNGNVVAAFACSGYSVVVGSSVVPTTVGQAASVPTPVGPQAPAGTTVAQVATVSISDSGFSPTNVAVTTGGTASTAGTVTFVNNGTNLHTAASGSVMMVDQRFSPDVFDTGGLNPGESKSFNFVQPGTYQFNSATDCMNGNTNPNFNCGAVYTVTVVRAPVGSTVSSIAPPFSGPIIYWRDPAGFDPGTMTVQPGQTVTWMNLGHDVHSVVSDSATMPFDSGGMGPGSVFTVTYTTPGSYPYHSSTEPIWTGNQITGYQFRGTVVVQ